MLSLLLLRAQLWLVLETGLIIFAACVLCILEKQQKLLIFIRMKMIFGWNRQSSTILHSDPIAFSASKKGEGRSPACGKLRVK